MMKIRKGIIKCLLNAVEEAGENAHLVSTHNPGKDRVIVKLVYFSKERWEPVKKEGVLFADDDISKALNKGVSDDQLKRSYHKDDTILPFVVVINPGEAEGFETGQLWQVQKEQVTGETHTPEFLALASSMQKERKDNEGNPMLEVKGTNIQVKITALEKNWAKLRVESPWLEFDKHDVESYLFYELPTPHFKSKISIEALAGLLYEDEFNEAQAASAENEEEYV